MRQAGGSRRCLQPLQRQAVALLQTSCWLLAAELDNAVEGSVIHPAVQGEREIAYTAKHLISAMAKKLSAVQIVEGMWPGLHAPSA